MLTWAGLALIVAGIVAWMLGNRTRALLMIATGACVSVVTLLALEVASLLMWPAVLIALIVSVTVLARWALPIWKRLRS
jgi:hypothetical protein